MRLARVSLLFLALMLIGICPAAAEEKSFVGIVKSVDGGAIIQRGGTTIPVVPGMNIHQADIVKTDGRGTIGLVFSDDTRVSMGPNTRLTVDEYLFSPKDQELSFVLRLIQGSLSFLSGQMTKLSPESVRLILPAATIGVRGTHILVKVD